MYDLCGFGLGEHGKFKSIKGEDLNGSLSSNPTPFGMNPMHSIGSKRSVCLLFAMAYVLPRKSAQGEETSKT